MNTALKVSREYGDTMPENMLALADQVGEETFTRQATDAEKAVLLSSLSEIVIREEQTADEKKESAKLYNEQLKELRSEKKEIVRVVRTGVVEVCEQVFTFLDPDRAMVHKYDIGGKRIASRRMTTKEAQLEIK